MNPYNSVLNGPNPYNHLMLTEGMAGFSFSRMKKKLRRAIRKVAKVAAPIVAGVVGGPAAAGAVLKTVVDYEQSKAMAAEAAKQLGQQQQYAIDAAQTVQNIKLAPPTQAITDQLLAQGYTPEQANQLFYASQPVQQVVRAATAGAVYDQALANGYSEDRAAATVRAVDQNVSGGVDLKTVLSIGLPLLILVAGKL